jgi:hypothetical protein
LESVCCLGYSDHRHAADERARSDRYRDAVKRDKTDDQIDDAERDDLAHLARSGGRSGAA